MFAEKSSPLQHRCKLMICQPLPTAQLVTYWHHTFGGKTSNVQLLTCKVGGKAWILGIVVNIKLVRIVMFIIIEFLVAIQT